MNTPGSSASESATLAQSIAHQLRDDVLNGRYPPGERLRLEDLKNNFGVSWSPVREAVTRLVSEGLIVADSQKSYRVAPASRAELAEAIELRVLLETRALRDSIARGNDAWEVEVLSAHHRLAKLESQRISGQQISDWEAWHHALHQALTQACGSPILLQFCQHLNTIHDRYRRIFFTHHDVDRDVAAEHRQITEATLGRDSSLACKLLADHIERTGRNILATMPE